MAPLKVLGLGHTRSLQFFMYSGYRGKAAYHVNLLLASNKAGFGFCFGLFWPMVG